MYIFRWIFRYQLKICLCLVQVTDVPVELMVICCSIQSLSRHEFKVATWWKSLYSALSLAKATARDETKEQILDKHSGQGPMLVQHICTIVLAATPYDWTSMSLPGLPGKNVWNHVPHADNSLSLGSEITDNFFSHCLSVFSTSFYNKHVLLEWWRKKV